MAQQSMQEMQRGCVLKMLNLGDGDSVGGCAMTWKVLVYDKFCQDVIAPLLKVGGLRKMNVTLNQTIESERQAVLDTPVVYFVEPTADNIAKIVMDLEAGLYPSSYINFVSAVPRSLLEDLAQGALKGKAGHKVAGVYDRYMSFVSLAPTLFSLNLPSAYETIHSPSIADHIIQQYIERIVDGLLSVLITAKALPIIRCPPNEVAEMVGRRLEERIRELLSKGAVATELFSGSTAGLAGAAEPGGQRPLLCILDRDMDLVTMLNHTWTYQAMAHDILGMRLNRLTVPVESSSDSSAPPKPKSYDVDDSDSFWMAHAGDPFPNVADAVSTAIDEYNKRREEMSASKESDDPTQSITRDLAAAFNSLPEMTEKKRSIDMHTNIATALMSEVNARELHHYYEMEDQFSSQSVSTSVSQLEKILTSTKQGTVLDMTRALMVLYLTKPSITEAQLRQLSEGLQANGGDISGLGYLQHLASIRNMMVPNLVSGPGPAGSSGSSGSSIMGGAFGGLADRLRQGGQGLLDAGLSNIKNILPSKKELVICKVMESLMEQKPSPDTDNFIYLDPKAAGGEAPRLRSPFRRAFAFVVGGGNYAEMQSLQEWAQAHQRQVIYGSTDLVAPAQFVEELSHLGQAQGGGGAGDVDLR
uniref:Uncharacterized protein n=2 Tax=Alexandrium monilatum TaxID=311494 RepID=A0A7S4Q283_9DINO|mmetsp:Transcript_6657/g.20996  ORF Transcript_6657/g.20996 Transcript_6657/m.20996 type:complete len:643 (+) Transcript_6657:127-2055(+)